MKLRDPYWRLESRVATCQRFRNIIKRGDLRLRKIRELKPGKQATVRLEKDTKSGIETVVKRSEVTKSVGREKRAASKGHLDQKHPWKTEPLVEIRLGRIISTILERKICPNLVFQYEVDLHLDDLQFANYLERFDNTLYNLTKAQKKHGEAFWLSTWFQLCAGLVTMHRNKIQHTDLHLNNVFYRKIKSGGYWTYILGQKKFYVPNTGYVFAIADYGRARSVNLKSQVHWHLQRVQQKIRSLGLNWEAYDYFRLHNQLSDKLPFPMYHEFNVLPKKGLYPVESAMVKIFSTKFATKPAGVNLGTYHITKKITEKEIHEGDYLDSFISNSSVR